MFGWPYPPKAMNAGSGTTNVGWGFGVNGTRGYGTWNSDNMYVQQGGKWDRMYLGINSNWYHHGTTNLATDMALRPGMGYYYFSRGSDLDWTAPRD